MRKSLVILLAGIACILMLAAGCTSTSGTTPATTTATAPATPAATTAAAVPSVLPIEVTTAAAANTTAAPAAPVNATTTAATTPLSWSGSWNTTYSMAGSADVIEMLVLNQTGSSVTGYYGTGNYPIAGTVKEGTFTGTWNETDKSGTYSGFFVFETVADGKSFVGKWVYTTEGADALKNTTQKWNGVRV